MDQFQAASEGNLRWFKENTYDIKALGNYGIFSEETIFAHASIHGRPEVCSLLLSEGALVDEQNDDGWIFSEGGPPARTNSACISRYK